MSNPAQFTLTKANLKGRNRAGGRAFAQVRKINIEGEMLTMPEIAKRLHADIRAVRGRYAKALEQPGPVTWAKLRKQ